MNDNGNKRPLFGIGDIGCFIAFGVFGIILFVAGIGFLALLGARDVAPHAADFIGDVVN